MVHFTVIFRYAVLPVLLVRGVTLDGSSTGLSFYVTSNATKLVNAGVRVLGDLRARVDTDYFLI